MEKFITYRKAKIHYTIQGAGQTIVLLHGFSESLEVWTKLNTSLTEKFSTICIDLPGHGKSESYATTHTMDEMAEITHTIITTEKSVPTTIVGHSMGGYVALAYAEKYPSTTKSICLLHSTSYADSEKQKENRLRTIRIIENNKSDFLCHFIPDLFASDNKKIFKTEINQLIRLSKAMTAEGLIASIKGMMIREDRSAILAKMNSPILFIAGKEDKRLPIEDQKRQAFSAKNGSFLLLENSGHMGYIEETALCARAIESFANSTANKSV